MAVTSIWSIKGWIGKVIKYAENPDKTKENNEGQISENQSQSTQGLEDVITYAVNAEKIRRRQSESMEMELVGEAEELMEQYVSGVNCAPTTAREEMIAVKIRADRPEEEIQEMKIMIVKPQVGKMHLPESFFGQIVSAGAVRDCRQIFGTAAKRLIGLLVFGDFG